MTNHLRRYVTQHIEHTQGYRSWYISAFGQEVTMRKVSADGSNIYGDQSAITESILDVLPLLINWEEFNRLLEFSTASTHDTVPLTASARIEDDIPTGSILTIEMQLPFGEEKLQVVDFKVTHTKILHNVRQHSKEITMTPWRGGPTWR